MEIKRVGENTIRCALTEEEIQDMGFEIDEIVGNGEMTQRFMRVVLELVEEQEDIDIEQLSPVVRAELLSDHSMAITFGDDGEMSMKELLETLGNFIGKMTQEKIAEFDKLTPEEQDDILAEFAKSGESGGLPGEMMKSFVEHKKQQREQEQTEPKESGKGKVKAALSALKFHSLDEAVRMSRVCKADHMPKSMLYRKDGEYYLIMEFANMTKDEIRPFAFGAVEYDSGRLGTRDEVNYLMEHGECILRKDALQMLQEL